MKFEKLPQTVIDRDLRLHEAFAVFPEKHAPFVISVRAGKTGAKDRLVAAKGKIGLLGIAVSGLDGSDDLGILAKTIVESGMTSGTLDCVLSESFLSSGNPHQDEDVQRAFVLHVAASEKSVAPDVRRRLGF